MKIKCILTIALSILIKSISAQIHVYEKPAIQQSILETKLDSISQLANTQIYTATHDMLRTYILKPNQQKSLQKLKNKISTTDYERLQQQSKIQYDWSKNKKNESIETEISELLKKDQDLRMKVLRCYEGDPKISSPSQATGIEREQTKDSCKLAYEYDKKQHVIDSINIIKLDSIIDLYGFPKDKWIGKSSFFIIYFAHNSEKLIHHFSDYKKAMDLKLVNKYSFPTYEDRYRLLNCQPQKNNKIWCKDKQGNYVPCTPCQYLKKCKCDE